MMAKTKNSVPASMTREQAADFWDTHCVSDYLDDLEPVNEPLEVAGKNRSCRCV